jgi:hypothetical protein
VCKGALASCDNEKELMDQVKRLLETRQKEPRSASKVRMRIIFYRYIYDGTCVLKDMREYVRV